MSLANKIDPYVKAQSLASLGRKTIQICRDKHFKTEDVIHHLPSLGFELMSLTYSSWGFLAKESFFLLSSIPYNYLLYKIEKHLNKDKDSLFYQLLLQSPLETLRLIEYNNKPLTPFTLNTLFLKRDFSNLKFNFEGVKSIEEKLKNSPLLRQKVKNATEKWLNTLPPRRGHDSVSQNEKADRLKKNSARAFMSVLEDKKKKEKEIDLTDLRDKLMEEFDTLKKVITDDIQSSSPLSTVVLVATTFPDATKLKTLKSVVKLSLWFLSLSFVTGKNNVFERFGLWAFLAIELIPSTEPEEIKGAFQQFTKEIEQDAEKFHKNQLHNQRARRYLSRAGHLVLSTLPIQRVFFSSLIHLTWEMTPDLLLGLVDKKTLSENRYLSYLTGMPYLPESAQERTE